MLNRLRIRSRAAAGVSRRVAFSAQGLLVVLLWAAGAAAQAVPEPVFVPAPATSAAAGARSRVAAPPDLPVVAREVAGMHLDRVFGRGAGEPRLALNLFGRTLVAERQRLDADAQGYRSWVGRLADDPDSHVVITEREGVVSGLIVGTAGTYQIRTLAPGAYALEEVDTSLLGDELAPADSPIPGNAAAPSAASADTAGTIDILLLYTPAMRAAAGGSAQVGALLAQIVSNTNTAFLQSGVPTQVRLAGSAELSYAESVSGIAVDLNALSVSQAAAALRDAAGADLVQLLVHSPGVSAACGVAYLMNTGLFGQAFAPYAYSVADWRCASQFTPTHEMGHNMGSHHAPEDGASGALFPYSYGYKSPLALFRTVMAYNCSPSCQRVLRFSNPSLSYLGGVTGTATQNNAVSLAQAAYTVANFRQAPTAPQPGTTPPAAPTGLQALVSGTTVSLSWNAVTSDTPPSTAPDAATSYRLAVGNTPGASNLFNQSVGNATAVSGQVPVGSYYWRVFAANAGGESPASSEGEFTVISSGGCTVAPGPPQSFSFSRAGSLVTLQWSAPASGDAPTSYAVEAGSATGLADLYNQAVGNTLAVSVQAPPGVYYVRIRAGNACGTSLPSAEQVIVVP